MLKFYNSAFSALKNMLNNCRKFIIKKSKRIVSWSTLAAFVAGAVLICANYRVGYTIMVDDVILGTVAAKSDYYQLLNEIKEEVNTISEKEFEPATEEKFTLEIVPLESFTKKEELSENIKATDENMIPAFSITADNEFIIAVTTEKEANRLLDEYIGFYDTNEENIQVSPGAVTKITSGYFPQDTVLSYEKALAELTSGKVISHTASAEDTPDTIAAHYNSDPDKILKTNDIADISEGMILKIPTDEPVIPIKTVEYIDKNIEIPFDTKTVEDDTVYRGQTRIRTKGEPGTKYLNAYITKINGVITEENIINTHIIKEPVTEVIATGTKELPPSAGTGEFIMPTSGRLSSPYGERWGRTHAGIDIAATTGTPIYAADNGIVIESEYQKNGYGNIIKVDHQNGFVTYYAHCSELYVKPGDIVAKGDLIAAVGSTGRSTGPHLHFEIRKDGNHKDPFLYIK